MTEPSGSGGVSEPPTIIASRRHRVESEKYLLFALSAVWLLFGVINLALARPVIAAIHFGAFGTTLALLVGTRGHRLEIRLRAHIGAAITALGLFGVALFTGQSDSIAVWYLFVVPVFVGQQGRWPSMITWLLICGGLASVVLWSESFYAIEPEHIFDEVERSIGVVAVPTFALIYTLLIPSPGGASTPSARRARANGSRAGRGTRDDPGRARPTRAIPRCARRRRRRGSWRASVTRCARRSTG